MAKLLYTWELFLYTVKPVLNGHLKIDKTKVLMKNGSLMKVEYCRMLPLEHSAILLICIKQKPFFVFFLSGGFRQVLL